MILKMGLLFAMQVENSFATEFSRVSGQRFQIYRGSGTDLTSNVQMSSLWGKSRVMILKNIKMSNITLGPIVDHGCTADSLQYWQHIFIDMHAVYEEISSPIAFLDERIDIVQTNICNLIARIRNLIGPDLITPYMHVLESHVATMIKSTPFKSMGAFSCQSLELKNSHQSSVLFRQTMKGGGKSAEGVSKTNKILLDILNLELCLTFSCRDRQNV